MVNFLIITLYAGHGMLKDGMQSLLMNEFDNLKGFYKMIYAEKIARDWASHPNTYVIVFFACCRQLYKESRYEKSGIDARTLEEDRTTVKETQDVKRKKTFVKPEKVGDEKATRGERGNFSYD